MKRFKVLGFAVFAMSVVLVAQASAVTLPDIHTVLPGDVYPIVGEGKAEVKGGTEAEKAKELALQTEVSKNPAASVLVKLEARDLTSLGPITIDLFGVHEPKKPAIPCHTEGDGEGVVLVPGAEFHIVPINATSTAGVLVLFPTIKVFCVGGITVTTEAPSLSELRIPATEDITSFEAKTTCASSGIASNSTYFNDAGEEVKGATLKANFGGGLENACEQTPPVTISSTKMFTILNP
jgi:hypothetical protein